MAHRGFGGVSRQFRSYPLQSVLLVAAVALGVAVVTAVAAFLDLNRQAERRLTGSVWARQIELEPKENDRGAFYAGGTPTPVRELGLEGEEPATLEPEDVERVREAVPSADYVYTTVYQFIISDRVDAAYLSAFGVTEDYLAANDVRVTQGSLFSERDFAENRDVALLTPALLRQARIAGNPIGKKLHGFEIIGVLPDAVPDPLVFQPEMLIPFPSYTFNPPERITLVVDDVRKVGQARAELAAYAADTWGERVNVTSNSIARYRAGQRTTALVIAGLASVGLVVASLNIMNLMLARVLKGSRDIGVLRSLGATRAAIVRRYLADALTLGALGGALGVGLGFVLVGVFNGYIRAADPQGAQVYTVGFSLPAAFVGLLLSLAVTLLFALYPSLVAARTNVVTALKGL